MKALGITAMIFAIVFIFVPFGGFVTPLASIMAAFAAGPGLTFGATAILVGLINTLVLSPSVWIGEFGPQTDGFMGPGIVIMIIHIACGAFLYYWNKKKNALAVEE